MTDMSFTDFRALWTGYPRTSNMEGYFCFVTMDDMTSPNLGLRRVRLLSGRHTYMYVNIRSIILLFLDYMYKILSSLFFFYKQASVYQRISTHVETEPVCTFLLKVNWNNCLIGGEKIRTILMRKSEDMLQNILYSFEEILEKDWGTWVQMLNVVACRSSWLKLKLAKGIQVNSNFWPQ